MGSAEDHSSLPEPIRRWFAARGWRIRRHQAEMVAAAGQGEDALLVASTGAGKTLAGFLASIADLAEHPREGLHTLYVSPLKALTVDVQRNLVAPLEEMDLPFRVETRTGDTPSDRKARQRVRPPHFLLTTPESLSLMLSHEDSPYLFADLRCVIVDEVHAFAPSKRGDLLSLALARLQSCAPQMRRVALSATVGEPEGYRRWLSRDGSGAGVRLVRGEPGAPPDIAILTPEGRVPWGGHSGRYAAAQVYEEIKRRRLTLIFCNTRSLAELMLADLWALNADNLPIGLHHGSLSLEVRRKAEEAIARGQLRALVCTASLDLGVDWGDVDLVVQMGAPKGASRLVQRIGRANHRLDEPSRALVVPGNRFEYLEARAALDAIDEQRLDKDRWRPGALDVLAQHVMALACAAPFDADTLFAQIRRAAPYAALERAEFDRLLDYIASGGYALAAYDRYQRLRRLPDGRWSVSHPRFIQQHRLNAGIIVEAPMLDVRLQNRRSLGKVEEYFASTLTPGDSFRFAGLALEVVGIRDTDLIVRATTKSARIPAYMGARLALTTDLAERVRRFLHEPGEWHRFPPDVREWLEVQARRSALPAPHELLVETFPHEGAHYCVAYPFEGWNAHQSLGMLLTRRMESQGLHPLGFVASDHAIAVYGLKPIVDPAPLFTPDILADELADWVRRSYLLKRAFREVAVIGGLVERQHPGKRKTGKQVTFSTDLIYDVLQKYEPDHLLLHAAWEDARTRLVDVARLADLVERAGRTMLHRPLARVSPLAVPLMVMVGREAVSGRSAEDALLVEAEEALAAMAMRED